MNKEAVCVSILVCPLCGSIAVSKYLLTISTFCYCLLWRFSCCFNDCFRFHCNITFTIFYKQEKILWKMEKKSYWLVSIKSQQGNQNQCLDVLCSKTVSHCKSTLFLLFILAFFVCSYFTNYVESSCILY